MVRTPHVSRHLPGAVLLSPMNRHPFERGLAFLEHARGGTAGERQITTPIDIFYGGRERGRLREIIQKLLARGTAFD